MISITDHLFLFEDTCNVYVIVHDDRAVLIDFGSGEVLRHLSELGVSQVTDVLMTHHHRDQGQGLALAAQAGACIWVPYAEQDLFARVDRHWQSREIYNNYNVRQDRFSLLEPVPIAGTLRSYQRYTFSGQPFDVLPTPGHTPGSISLLAEIDGQRFAFTGDLIAAPGHIWSLAATQWTYNGAEGMAYSIPALLDVKARQPDALLPSHGAPIHAPAEAIGRLVERLRLALAIRGQNLDLFDFMAAPYEAITPHLLRSRASVAVSYLLLSDTGKALMIDFGYDFSVGFIAGSDRASRCVWLHSLPALKRQFGVDRVDVVIPTHPHDDHVAGINLLREVEGAQVWAAEEMAPVLEDPAAFDLPCLWYDPIPVDRRLPVRQPIQWEGYTLTLYPLPGHTHYAVAISFEVDGRRVLATGDQYQGESGMKFNYVFESRYHLGDYAAGARLYRELSPDIILPGHWQPLRVTPRYLDGLVERADHMERTLAALLPNEIAGFDAEGFGARIQPYQVQIKDDAPACFQVEVRNPFSTEEEARLEIVVPAGWQVSPTPELRAHLLPLSSQIVKFSVTAPHGLVARRSRLAIDVTIGSQHFGQQAEALVDVNLPDGPEAPLIAEEGQGMEAGDD